MEFGNRRVLNNNDNDNKITLNVIYIPCNRFLYRTWSNKFHRW